MKLSHLRLHCPGTLGDAAISFCDDMGVPRQLTLVYGGAGSGKTTLLKALVATRPGHVVSMGLRPSEPPCFATCDWLLGMDEPDRQHPLRLTSPNAPPEFVRATASGPQQELVQRREAAFFERLAREGGFAFLSISSLRWFSKSPLAFHSPERTVARYDPRAFEPLDDAGRNDLTRDVKQALAYAAITAALPQALETDARHERLGHLMHSSVDRLVQLYGYRYIGLSRSSLEPVFTNPAQERLAFDALPTTLKHAAAFPALLVRLLWAAYPNLDPQRAQAVVAVDQFELHQDEQVLGEMVDSLLALFPEVQWVLTTRSASFLSARDENEIIALRRSEESRPIDVHAGSSARVH